MALQLNRERAVRRLDWLVRLSVALAIAAALAVLLLVVGNQAHYGLAKRHGQFAKSERVNIDLVDLPPGAGAWRLPVDKQGDPYDDYIRAQLDFRAYEKDYIATKLLGVPMPPTPQGPGLLIQAARRAPRELTLAQETALRPVDLRDAASALLRDARARRSEMIRLQGIAGEDTTARRETLRREADERMRAYYTTGLYLATRRFRLAAIQAGCAMMREGAESMQHAAEADGRLEEAARLREVVELLLPVTERLEELQQYLNDDRDLEIWVRMLEDARSPAVRLHGAGLLAQAARRWWRYSESARAIEALRRALTASYNYPIRAALFDLIDGAERGLILPPETPVIEYSGDPGTLQAFLDALY